MALFTVVPSLLSGSIAKKEPVHITVYDGTGVLIDSLASSIARTFTLPDGRPMFIITRAGTDTPFANVKRRADSDILSETSERQC